jgi:hypothetical protein
MAEGGRGRGNGGRNIEYQTPNIERRREEWVFVGSLALQGVFITHPRHPEGLDYLRRRGPRSSPHFSLHFHRTFDVRRSKFISPFLLAARPCDRSGMLGRAARPPWRSSGMVGWVKNLSCRSSGVVGRPPRPSCEPTDVPRPVARPPCRSSGVVGRPPRPPCEPTKHAGRGEIPARRSSELPGPLARRPCDPAAHGGTMRSDFLSSLAPHGHGGSESTTPWDVEGKRSEELRGCVFYSLGITTASRQPPRRVQAAVRQLLVRTRRRIRPGS